MRLAVAGRGLERNLFSGRRRYKRLHFRRGVIANLTLQQTPFDRLAGGGKEVVRRVAARANARGAVRALAPRRGKLLRQLRVGGRIERRQVKRLDAPRAQLRKELFEARVVDRNVRARFDRPVRVEFRGANRAGEFPETDALARRVPNGQKELRRVGVRVDDLDVVKRNAPVGVDVGPDGDKRNAHVGRRLLPLADGGVGYHVKVIIRILSVSENARRAWRRYANLFKVQRRAVRPLAANRDSNKVARKFAVAKKHGAVKKTVFPAPDGQR